MSIFLFTLIHSWVEIWLYYHVISLIGDVEVNPGPRTKASNPISVWQLNLNSVSAHNYSKVSLLKAYLTANKFDIVCLSETYLDSNTASASNTKQTSDSKTWWWQSWTFRVQFNKIRSSSNSKRGSAYIYNKNFLHLRVLDIQHLHEYINIEPKIGDKLCYIIALYRSPSQSLDKFEKLSEKLELNLDKFGSKQSLLSWKNKKLV